MGADMDDIFRNIVILEDRCKGCYLCIEACPKNCLEIGTHINIRSINPVVFVRPEDCILCEDCAVVCPDLAIEIYQRASDNAVSVK